MKIDFFILFFFVFGCAFVAYTTGFVTYVVTRDKWYDLGQSSGEIHGKAEVMRELCKFSRVPRHSPTTYDYILSVKAHSLYVVKTDQGLNIVCSL